MPDINVRNLPVSVHAKLRVRAAGAGRSMEAEVRAILTRACQPEAQSASPESLQSWVDGLYRSKKKPRGLTAALIRERRRDAAAENDRS